MLKSARIYAYKGWTWFMHELRPTIFKTNFRLGQQSEHFFIHNSCINRRETEMASYAALTSLMGTIHLISQSSLDLQEGHKKHLKLLSDKVSSVRELLDNSDDDQMKDLQKKVKDLANEAEDEVESQLRLVSEKDEHIRTEATERLLTILHQAIEGADSVTKELIKLKATNRSLEGSSSPRSHVSILENDMVGYNIEQELMRGQLTGHSSQLEVISVAGMGGIGKSTFARRMFSDPSILSFFDFRGWITVSKDYSLRKMLLSLLQDAIVEKEKKEKLEKKSNGDLADLLQKSLKGRRYLIVVDDIWSREAWDDIRLWFPEYNIASRILLTTRDMKVAQYASSPEDPFPMRPLELEESWNLFCQKAFDKKDCPTEFENVAKLVVENCKGLPLMISVVAGALSSKRRLEEWREVAQRVSSLVNLDDYQRCSGVLALSYKHLPSHLKACFLYFGVFPKAREISVKKLIRLWAAEGLLELKGLEGLEKLAPNLLHDLIDKNLVVVSTRSLCGRIKACRIHDLLHDLCLREAKSEMLLYSYVVDPVSYGAGKILPEGRRWVSVHSNGNFRRILFDDLTHSKTRSLHFSGNDLWQDSLLSLDHFKLLRVLDLEAVEFSYFPSEILHLVGLRYLALAIYEIPEDVPISNLWNLQTLIVSQSELDGRIGLPIGIWGLSQLRHLHCTSMYVHSPRKVSVNEVKQPILEKLLSVSGLSLSCCTKEIFEGIKKVKKLGIFVTVDDFTDVPECLDNLIHMHELETLNIAGFDMDLLGFNFRLPRLGSFPPNLKKLTLSETYLPWEDMTIISQLPKLEVLQLKNSAFVEAWSAERWEVTEMGFPELKFLLLEELDLKYWRAADIDDNFPCLERVVIRNCRYLKQIPKVFADSGTLQRIELWGCSPSLVTFAKKIQRNHEEDLGNNMLKVYDFDTIGELNSNEVNEEAAEGDVEKTVRASDEETGLDSDEESEDLAMKAVLDMLQTELDSDEEAGYTEKTGQSSRGRDRSKAYVYKNFFAPLLVDFFPNFHLEETEEDSSK
ncbi:putative late blight resistance protein homolog R1A-3 [Nicotiana tabacum]|uniref:Late blight resistance protein homolog R1A-10 n=1 Tax=Nicotiana tabacum TaxID=4097 RepID=A0A1S4AV17_TOBAC|nr:PREDICTED: putative late blight resistance protein homolog R1A-10 [Nicotiana tabacum]